MGDVIPFPIVKRLPGDGLRAAMQELDQALDELNALRAIMAGNFLTMEEADELEPSEDFDSA